MHNMISSKILRYSAFFMLAVSSMSCSRQASEWFVDSPSGNLRFTVALADSGRLFYTVALTDSGKTTTVIEPSPMGIIRDNESFNKDLVFEKANDISTIKENIELPSGKQKSIDNNAKELSLSFRNPAGTTMQITARAYDDVVAFRYSFPDSADETCTIENEITAFDIGGDGDAWMQPYDRVTKYTPAYETYYENTIPIGTESDSAEGWAFPALFRINGAWILLTEASVDSTSYAAHLQPVAVDGKYAIRLPEEEEAMNTMPQKPEVRLPWIGPWRVIITGSQLSAIFESNLVSKLGPEPIKTFDWVKPGRASWSWWSEPSSPKDYSALKRFVDLSAEMGWEYSLVDANWDLMKGGNVEQLTRYANSKNVGILLWYNSGGPHNVVTERPRDLMNDPVKRREEFKRIAALGVKGVKVDFFQSDKPQMMKLYLDILRDAADHNIFVVFHGCTVPKGWNRTWPNLISMEAVRGAENYQFDSLYPEKAVWHNTILPFTRNVVGSMDYTPVAFTNQKYPHQTTRGYEMALSIVFESGVLHFADRVEAYQALPEKPKEFLKNIPVTWDETRL
ncbi:glycoside hydrolase family 97 protein, partial [bacterium]